MCFLEYGPNSTRRPHWHFLLINSDYNFAKFLFHAWKVGFCKVFKNGSTKMYFGYGRKSTLQKVNLYSKRYKGNGFKNVAGYVSKYVAKGCFDSPAVNMRLTVPVRVLTSKHFGAQLSEEERRHFLALDLYHYNPNCLDHVPADLLSKIVDTIIRRLHFYFDESCKTTREERKPFPYKLPKVLQAVIFDKRIAKTRSDLPDSYDGKAPKVSRSRLRAKLATMRYIMRFRMLYNVKLWNTLKMNYASISFTFLQKIFLKPLLRLMLTSRASLRLERNLTEKIFYPDYAKVEKKYSYPSALEVNPYIHSQF